LLSRPIKETWLCCKQETHCHCVLGAADTERSRPRRRRRGSPERRRPQTRPFCSSPPASQLPARLPSKTTRVRPLVDWSAHSACWGLGRVRRRVEGSAPSAERSSSPKKSLAPPPRSAAPSSHIRFYTSLLFLLRHLRHDTCDRQGHWPTAPLVFKRPRATSRKERSSTRTRCHVRQARDARNGGASAECIAKCTGAPVSPRRAAGQQLRRGREREGAKSSRAEGRGRKWVDLSRHIEPRRAPIAARPSCADGVVQP